MGAHASSWLLGKSVYDIRSAKRWRLWGVDYSLAVVLRGHRG